MTVRQRIDQLISEPAVGDLGYPADQRSVATMELGLKLLADSIDEIEDRLSAPHGSNDTVTPVDLTPEVQDFTAQVEALTAQVGTLATIIRKLSQRE